MLYTKMGDFIGNLVYVLDKSEVNERYLVV